MRENRLYGSEGGESQLNAISLPLSLVCTEPRWVAQPGESVLRSNKKPRSTDSQVEFTWHAGFRLRVLTEASCTFRTLPLRRSAAQRRALRRLTTQGRRRFERAGGLTR